MERLRHRAEFLAAASGSKASTAAFILQARRREDAGPARFGFTASRKVGGAVVRNRIRRRLKEMVNRSTNVRVKPGYDYVVVARAGALTAPFDQLMKDFDGALRRLDRPSSPPPSFESNR